MLEKLLYISHWHLGIHQLELVDVAGEKEVWANQFTK